MTMSGSPDEDPFRDTPVPCGACGDKEGGSANWGGCRNHPEYVFCHDGTLFPLIRGKTFDPGYPARGPSFSSGGEPGEPAHVMCPTCDNAEEIETACTSHGCPFEAWPFDKAVEEAFRHDQDRVRGAFLAFVQGRMSAANFRRELVSYGRIVPQVILDPAGLVVFETDEAVAARKRRQRIARRDVHRLQRRGLSWNDECAGDTLTEHLTVIEGAPIS
jgi:hypothetical protein